MMVPLAGGNCSVNVCDPDMAKRILMDHNSFPKATFVMNRWIKWLLGAENLFLSNGAEWKRQRTIVNPAFYRLEMFADIFVEKTKLALKKVDSRIAKEKGIVLAADLVQRFVC